MTTMMIVVVEAVFVVAVVLLFSQKCVGFFDCELCDTNSKKLKICKYQGTECEK